MNVEAEQHQQFDRGSVCHGEQLTNVVRMLLVSLCYALFLINQTGTELLANHNVLPVQLGNWLLTTTAAVIIWQTLALVVTLALQFDFYSAGLRFFSTLFDLLLLTVLLSITTLQQSPFVLGYFIILATTLLCRDRRLLWLAVLLAMLSYWAVGATTHELTNEDISVTGYQRLVTLSAMLLTGIIFDQLLISLKPLSTSLTMEVCKTCSGAGVVILHGISLSLLLTGVYLTWPALAILLGLMLISPVTALILLCRRNNKEQSTFTFRGAVLFSLPIVMTLLGLIMLAGCAALIMFCYYDPGGFI